MKMRFSSFCYFLIFLIIFLKTVEAQSMAQGQIYMTGGHNAGFAPLTDSWFFNPAVPAWSKQIPDVPWSNTGVRYHSSVWFQNKIWVLGGLTGNTWQSSVNDIWSFDGLNWKNMGKAPWSGRYKFESVVFAGQIWVMGGTPDYASELHDVWSFDGVTWKQHADAPWTGRFGHKGVVYQGEIWIMGGYTIDSYSKEVWSFNGTRWLRHADAPWSPRSDFGLAVFNNKIWILGGEGIGEIIMNDVWSFSNGSWMQLSNIPWQPREEFGVVVAADKLWVIGGLGQSGGNDLYFHDVWSFNGSGWTLSNYAPWTPRDGFTLVAIPKQSVDISVSKTVAINPKLASFATYTINVSNLGPDAAHNVIAQDQLPSTVSYVSHQFYKNGSAYLPGNYIPATGIISIPSINVGETITLNITVKELTNQTIVNTAKYLYSDELDTNPNNNSATATFVGQGAPPVSGPPVIVQDLSNSSILEGDSLFLNAGLSGSGPFTYEWWHNGVKLPFTGAYYFISSATFADAGTYYLIVRNAYGQAISRIATVAVNKGLRPYISTDLYSQTCVAGQPVTLNIEAVGAGPLTFQWWKNDGPVQPTDSYAAGSYYTIPKVSFSDDGYYQVLVFGKYGYAVGAYVKLTVVTNQAPVVNAGVNKSVFGQWVVLSGTATDDGYPNGSLSYKWSEISGPGTAVIVAPYSTKTGINVTAPGVYTFRLTVSDGILSSSDDVVVSFYF